VVADLIAQALGLLRRKEEAYVPNSAAHD